MTMSSGCKILKKRSIVYYDCYRNGIATAVLDPVTVYDADDVMAVGVPLIAPVELSMDSPEGRVGETDQEVTVPPLDVGVIVVITTPLVGVIVLGL